MTVLACSYRPCGRRPRPARGFGWPRIAEGLSTAFAAALVPCSIGQVTRVWLGRVKPSVHASANRDRFGSSVFAVSNASSLNLSFVGVTFYLTFLQDNVTRGKMVKTKRKFVSYLRVSTLKQGESGLGVEAQRSAVASFLNGGRWTHVCEFVETESGSRDDRPKLAEALAVCRLHNATLVIAKLDRLSRDAHFLGAGSTRAAGTTAPKADQGRNAQPRRRDRAICRDGGCGTGHGAPAWSEPSTFLRCRPRCARVIPIASGQSDACHARPRSVMSIGIVHCRNRELIRAILLAKNGASSMFGQTSGRIVDELVAGVSSSDCPQTRRRDRTLAGALALMRSLPNPDRYCALWRDAGELLVEAAIDTRWMPDAEAQLSQVLREEELL